MLKKLLFLIITSLITCSLSWAQILPLKKPSPSHEDLNKKDISNTIKPLKKPSKVQVDKKIIKKDTKTSFLLPKKKTTYKRINQFRNCKNF